MQRIGFDNVDGLATPAGQQAAELNKQEATERQRQQSPGMVDRTQRAEAIDRNPVKHMLNAMCQKLLDDGQDSSRQTGRRSKQDERSLAFAKPPTLPHGEGH